MKKLVFYSAMVVYFTVSSLQAQEILGIGPNVSGSVDIAYQSLYMWRGFDGLGGKSAFQVTADVAFADTGFGINVAAHKANSTPGHI